MRQDSTDNRPSGPDIDHVPFFVRRPHRKTGRRPGPPLGSQNALKHGQRSRDAVERRKAVMTLLRMVREAAAKTRD
jgi:hypothetical protein